MKPETINDLLVINRIAGLLECLAAMEGAPISRKAAILLEDAADRLMLYVGDEYTKGVNGDEITIQFSGMPEPEKPDQ